MNLPQILRALDSLRREIDEIRRRLVNLPTRWAAPAAPLPPEVLVKITAAATGGGEYHGTVYAGDCSVSAGNLALPYNLAAGQGVLVLNPIENGQPTHWIQLDTYVPCTPKPWTTAAGTPVMVVSGEPVYRVDSPAALSTHAGDLDNVNEKSWLRSRAFSGSQMGDCPFTLTVLCRKQDSAADGAGIVTRRFFSRTMTVDASGKLVSMSDESIAWTDEIEACAEGA